jgi:hypothetical protein
MRKLLIICGLATAIFMAGPAQAQFCNNALYAVPQINGKTMSLYVTSAASTTVPGVSGTVPLSIIFEPIGGGQQTPSGISLLYTVDDIAVGQPLSSPPYTYHLDTTAYTDGEHVLSVLYVAQPAWPSGCQFGRHEFPIVITNHGVSTGPQYLPIDTRPTNAIVSSKTNSSPAFDKVFYPGFRPHSVAQPYHYAFVSGAGGVDPNPAMPIFFVEPLNHVGSDFAEGNPDFYQVLSQDSANGAVVLGNFYEESSANIENAYDYVQNQDHWDGPRNDNSISPYSNCVPNLDGPGFYCISLEGRLYEVNMDGSIKTIAGLVTTGLPVYYSGKNENPPSAGQTYVGSFSSNIFFQAPVDLTIDPRPGQHTTFYVADTKNHRIAKVDTSGSTPVISTYAGVPGTAGYVDGPAASAEFNEPYSLVMDANGTMYVADRNNAAIRMITSAGVVSTLAHNASEGVNGPNTPAVVANNPSNFESSSVVPLSGAYINYPFVLRFTSAGDLVEGESTTFSARLINLHPQPSQPQTIQTIAQLALKGDPQQSWMWLDVDSRGNIGKVDDVVITKAICGGASCAYKVPITGDTNIPPAKLPVGTCSGGNGSIHFGSAACALNVTGHYSWMVAISATEGRVIFMGYGSLGIFSWRLDPNTGWALSATDYTAGFNLWLTGAPPNFPIGARPAFQSIHGYEVYSRLGYVKNADDMNALVDEPLCTYPKAIMQSNPQSLQYYLQNGAEGSVVRPELTGNDMQNLTYFVRKNAMGNTSLAAPSLCASVTPTITSGPTIAGNVVSWTTDHPTFGVLQWGTTTGQYFGWALESQSTQWASGTTVHQATLTNLPSQTIYYVLRVKSIPGQQAVSLEQHYP